MSWDNGGHARYMLRTAPPELIEQAHEEAFVRLTPEQRRTVLQLRETLPQAERAVSARPQDDPQIIGSYGDACRDRTTGHYGRTFGHMGGDFGGDFGADL